jgi:homocysteine S-methyltransferase
VKFLDALGERPLIGDGAMGTLIYAKGVPLAQSFDSLNLERPDLIREIHAMVDTGAA